MLLLLSQPLLSFIQALDTVQGSLLSAYMQDFRNVFPMGSLQIWNSRPSYLSASATPLRKGIDSDPCSILSLADMFRRQTDLPLYIVTYFFFSANP